MAIRSVGFKGPAWDAFPAGLVGELYEGKNGRVYRFVENAEGAAVGKQRTLKWNDRANYKVQYTDGLNDEVCGVTPDEMGTATYLTGDAFWMQVAGRVEVILGSGTASAIAGEWLRASADADQGKVDALDRLVDAEEFGPESMKTEAGLTLTGATVPSIAQASNKELALTYTAAAVAFVALPQWKVPEDYDIDADDARLVAICTKAGTTDNRTLDAEVYVRAKGAAAAAFGADLNPTAVALLSAGNANPKEISLDLSAKSLRPGDTVHAQLSLTNPGTTDAAGIRGAWWRYKSTRPKGAAFAKAVDAGSAVDGVITVELLPTVLRGA